MTISVSSLKNVPTGWLKRLFIYSLARLHRLIINCLILFPIAILFTVCRTAQDKMRVSTAPEIKPLKTIAFGSCNRVELPQDYWPIIQAQEPGLWIWLGDIIYADTDDMEAMQAMYHRQKVNPFYDAFIHQVPVIGVWDDHDYGVNDGGKNYPKREESKSNLLRFLGVDSTAAVYKHPGVYQALDVPLIYGNFVKIILLDVRSFRDSLHPDSIGPQRYEVNSSGDILGEEQWLWLQEVLDTSTAELNIIASGIQFLQTTQHFEKWANFPKALQRLYRLLAKYPDHPVLLLSGDRHIGEFIKREIPELNYPLYEITSSGLTHSYLQVKEDNEHRVGPVIGEKNFGFLNFKKHDQQLIIEASLMDPEEGAVHFTHSWSYQTK